MDSILSHRTARQRERHSNVLNRLCDARGEAAMQSIGGGSPDATPAPRAPRTTRRTTAKKTAKSGDSDGDGEPDPTRRRVFRCSTIWLMGPTRWRYRPAACGGWCRRENFGSPRALSARRVAWLVRDVEAWAESRPTANMLPPPSAA